MLSFAGYLKGKSAMMLPDRYANLKYKFGNRHFLVNRILCKHSGLNEATRFTGSHDFGPMAFRLRFMSYIAASARLSVSPSV